MSSLVGPMRTLMGLGGNTSEHGVLRARDEVSRALRPVGHPRLGLEVPYLTIDRSGGGLVVDSAHGTVEWLAPMLDVHGPGSSRGLIGLNDLDYTLRTWRFNLALRTVSLVNPVAQTVLGDYGILPPVSSDRLFVPAVGQPNAGIGIMASAGRAYLRLHSGGGEYRRYTLQSAPGSAFVVTQSDTSDDPSAHDVEIIRYVPGITAGVSMFRLAHTRAPDGFMTYHPETAAGSSSWVQFHDGSSSGNAKVVIGGISPGGGGLGEYSLVLGGGASVKQLIVGSGALSLDFYQTSSPPRIWSVSSLSASTYTPGSGSAFGIYEGATGISSIACLDSGLVVIPSGDLRTHGSLQFRGGTSHNYTLTGAPTAARTATFPDKSGTVAFTDDLPTPSAMSSENDTNVTLTLTGSPDTSLLAPVTLTLGWTGTLSASRGGTGSGAALANNRLIKSSGGALVEHSAVGAGQVYFGDTTTGLPQGQPIQVFDRRRQIVDRGHVTARANATATRSTMGADLTGTTKWRGLVTGPDGKIYCIPAAATDILVIAPAAGTATRSAMGADLSGGTKWEGGALGPDGKIYGVPYNSQNILIIDPISGTATRSTMGASLGGNAKWAGGALGPDGKIYCAPFNATDILIIDPLAGTATRSAMGAEIPSDSEKWYGATVGPDGKIYCVPYNSNEFLIIDPLAGTATISSFGLSLSGTNKWSGAILGLDGKLYCVPLSAGSVAIIDPATQSASLSTFGLDLSGSFRWRGGVAGPDGKIYACPSNTTTILIIDPISGTAQTTTLGASLTGGVKWRELAVGPDGRMFSAPENATDILIIDPAPRRHLERAISSHALLGPGAVAVTSGLDTDATIYARGSGTVRLRGASIDAVGIATFHDSITVEDAIDIETLARLRPVTSDPAAPATGCVVYCYDDGAGTVSFRARFANGEIRTLAVDA